MKFTHVLRILFAVLPLIASFRAFPQNYTFAQLVANPTMNTTGWTLAGSAFVGSTPVGNGLPAELILTDPINTTSGAAFFNTPVNITYCQRWVADFEFRMFDGTSADGLAFCFLTDPPRGFVRGAGLGVPTGNSGLVVGFDSYQNCNQGQTGRIPKIQLRYVTPLQNYSECPVPEQPTAVEQTYLRSNQYQPARIIYNNGNIEVFVNGIRRLTGFYNINFPGYFGFTASTGGNTDRHSIRNFTLKTFKPILSAPNPGPNVSICPNGVAQLGVTPPQNDPYTYRWHPTEGLSNPFIANPTVSLPNNTGVPVVRTYFLTKDTIAGIDSLCAFSAAVQVTVLGKGAQVGPPITLCSGEPRSLNVSPRSGFTYTWFPTTGLSNANQANPTLRLVNTSGQLETYTYVLRAVNNSAGCIDTDTLKVTLLPNALNAGPDRTICSGDRVQLGTAPTPNFLYTWTPSTGLSSATISNPTLQLVNNNTVPLRYTYILSAFSIQGNCTTYDTVSITVQPRPLVPIGQRIFNVCSNQQITLGGTPNPQLRYRWFPALGLNDSTLPNPTLNVNALNNSQFIKLEVTNIQGCRNLDSVRINFLPSPIASAGEDKTVCSGGTVSIGAGQPEQNVTYAWSPSRFLTDSTSLITQVVTPANSSQAQNLVYRLTATSADGCSFIDSVIVGILPSPEKTLPELASVCSGQSIQINNPSFIGQSYQWEQNPHLNTYNVANPLFFKENNSTRNDTTFLFLRTTADASGCSRLDTIRIIVFPAISADAGPFQELCIGSNSTLGATSANARLKFSWQPTIGLNNPTLPNPTLTALPALANSSIYYKLLVRDTVSGCEKLDSTLITFKNIISVDAGSDTAVCPNTEVLLGNGNQPIQGQFRWFPTENLSNPSNPRPSFRVSAAGTYSIFLEKQENGCFAVDTINITVFQPPIPSLRRLDSVCEGGPYRVVNPPIANYAYQWTASPGLADLNTPEPTILVPSPSPQVRTELKYFVKVTNTLTGCVWLDTLTVILQDKPSFATPTPLQICSGEPVELQPQLLAGYFYRWSGNAAQNLNSTTVRNPVFTFRNNSIRDTIITLQVKATNFNTGCEVFAEQVITVKPSLVFSAGQNLTELCQEDTIQIGSNPISGYTYSWEPQLGVSNPFIANPTLNLSGLTEGLYSYILTAQFDGCTETDTIRVLLKPRPSSLLPNLVVACSGVPTVIQHSPQPNYQYNWLDTTGLNNRLIANPTFTGSFRAGADTVLKYRVQITNSITGCRLIDTLGIQVFGPPIADAGSDVNVCFAQSQTIGTNAIRGYRYRWFPVQGISNPDTAQPEVLIPFDGTNQAFARTYYVEVFDSTSGCTALDSIVVNVRPLPRIDSLLRTYNVCSGSSIQIGVLPEQSVAYQWAPSNLFNNSLISNPTLSTSNLPIGPTTLFLTTTSADGCVFRDSVTLNVLPIPEPNRITGRTNLCPSAQQIRYFVNRRLGAISYQWEIEGGTFTSTSDTSVFVNWNTTSPTGKVIVREIGTNGCVGLPFELVVTFRNVPRLGQPTSNGNTGACINAVQTYLMPDSIPFANYDWFVSPNGQIIQGQGTARLAVIWTSGNIGSIWLNELSRTPTDTCLGLSDTLFIPINPKPADTLTLNSPLKFCDGQTVHTINVIGMLPNSTLNTRIVSGNGQIQPNQNGFVLTINQVGLVTAQIQEITAEGCFGPTLTYVFEQLPALQTSWQRIDSILCSTNNYVGVYSVSGNPTSRYLWQISQGQAVRWLGEDSTSVEILWNPEALNSRLTVTEVSENDCQNTLSFAGFKFDNGSFSVTNISATAKDEFTYNISQSGQFVGSPIPLLQIREGNQPYQSPIVSTVGESSLTRPSNQNYLIRAIRVNPCGDTVRSSPHGNVVLRLSLASDSVNGILTWNDYIGWKADHSLEDNIDGQGWKLYEQLAANTNLLNAPVGELGFTTELRIVAKETDGQRQSLSNVISLTLPQRPKIGNVITPNGDGTNDSFQISKLQLYPENELVIFNRFGKEVFRKTNYDNSFTGEGLPTGTYYYQLKQDAKNLSQKGWLEIIK